MSRESGSIQPGGDAAKAPPIGRTRNGLAFTKTGDGPPLVLLHGLGDTRAAWGRIHDRLAEAHTVYAVDLPDHGDSENQDARLGWSPRGYAVAVAAALDELGVHTPHVAGHSIGGWTALELADVRPVASLTLLAPAGLWKKGQPLYCGVNLYLTWAGCRFARPLFTTLSRWIWGRMAVFSLYFAHPEALSQEEAVRSITAMGRCRGFRQVMRACRPAGYRAAREVVAPVTLAFGDSDRLLLPSQSRSTDHLPPHTRHVVLADAGHVPMSDAPEEVLRTILATTRAVAS